MVNKELFKSLMKTGFSVNSGKKTWDISERRFLYMTPDLANGFLEIRKFPAYKKEVVDREIALIRAYSKTLSKEIGEGPINLIDIYCGDGKKAIEFVKSIKAKNIVYYPTNVSNYLTDIASKNMKDELGIQSKTIISDGYGHILKGEIEKIRNEKPAKNIILLLGSVLGSYEINDYLFELRSVMREGDILIIGNGVREGERLVNLEMYKHPIWNNWFIHLMKELGFKEDEVEYDARFNEVRVEGFYRINGDKKISVNGEKIEFKKGDEILAAILYKYYPEELEKFCKMYFNEVLLTLDSDKGYALVICKA